MTTSRTVYAASELAGAWELNQPTAVDGSAYTEPDIASGGVFEYTAEDDAALALQDGGLTIPATAEADDVAVVIAAVTDETDTAAVATPPEVHGTNEVQTLSSDRTGGTFTLDLGGAPTGALQAADETAANVQTALEGLAGVGAGQVACTGGPLDVADIEIEWTGTLGEQPVTDLNVTDSGTGGTAVTIAETTPGVSPVPFTLRTDFNIPQAGDNFQPQGHVWTLVLTAAEVGKPVRFTAADHDTLRSVAAVLVVVDNADTTGPIEVIGAETAGNAGNVATFGSATPLTEGAKALAVMAKAKAGGAGVYYTSTDSPTLPPGMTGVAEAQSDAMTLTVWRSGILDTDSYQPGQSSWSQSALWAAVVLIIAPATAAGAGAGLAAAVDTEDTTQWIDISDAAGAMYEILELDLASLPAGAVITSASVEVGHSCSVRNALRVALVGIQTDGSISPAVEQQPEGYVPLPVGQVADIRTAPWNYVADGTPLSSFDRLGIALISSTRHPYVADHRVFWARAAITYAEGGPVVSNVVGPVSAGDPVAWSYSSAAGAAQSHYRVMVIAGAGQDPDLATVAANPLDAAAGEIVFDSGQVPGVLVRSLTIDEAPLGRGAHTVAVRAWADVSGQSVRSDWATDDFDIGGAVATGAQAVDPAWNPTTGGVDVEVTVPAGVSRAWLLRSVDSGSTWVVADEAPYAVTPSTTVTLTDHNAPSQTDTVRYQVSFDDGAMTETGAPADVGTGGDVSTPGAAWWFRVPDEPSLNFSPLVQSFSIDRAVRSQTAAQAGGAVTAVTRTLLVTLGMSIWCRSDAERWALSEIVDSGRRVLISDVFGRSWSMTSTEGENLNPRRSKGNLATSRPLRDLHVVDVQFVGAEVDR